ncbi:hypothetical protein SUBVAR_05224 [Subdoligranulum variabile DSM 15176]|uniref:Uncharacterized protein n=1 Tax=Subdoligranulum variabile DSM 15176 TaxID=411471 RepID=D1PLK8_9FIRM|nr:hypothetical protein SUBVAR_05224 [Subdoligranulum variabile DSM 15176]
MVQGHGAVMERFLGIVLLFVAVLQPPQGRPAFGSRFCRSPPAARLSATQNKFVSSKHPPFILYNHNPA